MLKAKCKVKTPPLNITGFPKLHRSLLSRKWAGGSRSASLCPGLSGGLTTAHALFWKEAVVRAVTKSCQDQPNGDSWQEEHRAQPHTRNRFLNVPRTECKSKVLILVQHGPVGHSEPMCTHIHTCVTMSMTAPTRNNPLPEPTHLLRDFSTTFEVRETGY
jgi:hypothetical protein